MGVREPNRNSHYLSRSRPSVEFRPVANRTDRHPASPAVGMSRTCRPFGSRRSRPTSRNYLRLSVVSTPAHRGCDAISPLPDGETAAARPVHRTVAWWCRTRRFGTAIRREATRDTTTAAGQVLFAPVPRSSSPPGRRRTATCSRIRQRSRPGPSNARDTVPVQWAAGSGSLAGPGMPPPGSGCQL